MTDRLRIEAKERVDLLDFQQVAGQSEADLREMQANVLTNPAGSRAWILEGFAMDNPSAKQIRVTLGRAILAKRVAGEIQYGVLTVAGDAEKTVDLNTYSAGTYGVYVRFEEVEAEFNSRIFWNPAGDGSEYSQSIPTRYVASWGVRVESGNPGAEWLQIGEVDQATMAITDMRQFFFEGAVDDTYESGWSSEGGGGSQDRNSDRAQYGVTDFQTFTAAMRQSIEDLKGRGLRRWWDKGIGGMNIGFDDDPTEDQLGIGDTDLFLGLSGTDVTMGLGTDGSLEYDRAADKMTLTANSAAVGLVHDATDPHFSPEASGLHLGQAANRWGELYAGGFASFVEDDAVNIQLFDSNRATNAGMWSINNLLGEAFAISQNNDDGSIQFSPFILRRDGVNTLSASIGAATARVGIGIDNSTTDGCVVGLHMLPSDNAKDLGASGSEWRRVYADNLAVAEYVDTDLIPKTTATQGLGDSTHLWKQLHLSTVGGDGVAGSLVPTVAAGSSGMNLGANTYRWERLYLSDADGDGVAAHLIPVSNDDYTLGKDARRWAKLYLGNEDESGIYFYGSGAAATNKHWKLEVDGSVSGFFMLDDSQANPVMGWQLNRNGVAADDFRLNMTGTVTFWDAATSATDRDEWVWENINAGGDLRLSASGSTGTKDEAITLSRDGADFDKLTVHGDVSVVGTMEAAYLRAAGDAGSGTANRVDITNDIYGLGATAGGIQTDGSSGVTSVGWLKIYAGTSTVYIPYWTSSVLS